ncbi:LLM class oxidoreductase [Pseudomonas putida]|uniref:LLM class oxidoreductase n=1 Tax=Pseudomonas putida TaxID=303 RepID=A0A8I1JIJ1_PSEPU|nr:LLM class oxidoreductase [Pseudomonas putida]MBI6885052.1 LLM class oxidoreductase [Pseudomonas putida]
MNTMSHSLLPGLAPGLVDHPAFARVFQPGRLTFGFMTPIEGYPSSPFPTMENHQKLAQLAESAGFSALWLRDVPFYDPAFGDTGQVLDPFVYLGYLAAVTKTIALGTTGIVLPLRDPLIVAKQAVSVDQLTGGRLLLGLSSGDRPIEYPAFGVKFEDRELRFREAFQLIRTVTETDFPHASTTLYGRLNGHIDLVPKPFGPRMPMIVVGRARQSLEWIAQNADAWFWHISDFTQLPQLIAEYRAASNGKAYMPYGYSCFFDLDRDPDAPLERGRASMKIGRKALVELWKRQQEQGLTHVALNLKPLRRPATEMMDELGEHVLPHFPSGQP